jgi:hypothetical protein
MKLVVDGHDRQAYLDGNMLRNVVPRHAYDVGDNDDNVYFLPLDPTPFADEPSGILDLGRTETAELHLLLVPGKYRVDVLVRSFNVLSTGSGMAGLKFCAS